MEGAAKWAQRRPVTRPPNAGLPGLRDTEPVITVHLEQDELKLLHAALHAYLDDFGHDEAGLLRELKALIEKLPQPGPHPGAAQSAVSEL